MPDAPASSPPPGPPRLFCEHCEYDLTGLTENRCPECGNPFDLEYLLRRLHFAAKPIAWGMLVLQFCLLSCGAVATVVVAALADMEWLFGTVVISATIAFPLASIALTDRVFASHLARQGRSPYAKIRTTKRLALWAAFTSLLTLTSCLGGVWAVASLAD